MDTTMSSALSTPPACAAPTNRRRHGPRFSGDVMGVLEASRDLFCMTIDGMVTAINSAGLSLLGVESPPMVEGRRFLDFLVAEDVGAYDDGWLLRNAFRPSALSVRLRRLDDGIRDVELWIYRARELAPGAAVILGRDVTETSRLIHSAMRSEVRFSMLVENSMNLICHCRGDRVAYVNRAGARLLGLSDPSEIIGRPVWELFSEDYRSVLAGQVEMLLQEKGEVPVRLARDDGRPVDVQLNVTVFPSGEVLEYMIEGLDVTAHNHAVASLVRLSESLEGQVEQRTRALAEQRRLADEARHFLEGLLEAVPSPLWYKDCSGYLRAYNRAFRELHDIEGGAWVGRDLTCGGQGILHDDVDGELLNSRGHRQYEASIRTRDGLDRDVLVSKTAFVDSLGEVAGVIGMVMDISERKAMERELRRVATTDALTGASSRRHFLCQAAMELDRFRRHGRPASVLMLDIDYFKRVNDTYGHAVGDQALRSFAQACAHTLRESDILGRLGGEEFAILLPETSLPGAVELAERLRQVVAEVRLQVGDIRFGFTTSIGATELHPADTSVEMAMQRADMALYEAKRAGRNRVGFRH